MNIYIYKNWPKIKNTKNIISIYILLSEKNILTKKVKIKNKIYTTSVPESIIF